jgi:hypothetical protein
LKGLAKLAANPALNDSQKKAVSDLSRNDAVGQASRRSLTLNNLLAATVSKACGCPPKGEGISLDGNRRDACPTEAGGHRAGLAATCFRLTDQVKMAAIAGQAK